MSDFFHKLAVKNLSEDPPALRPRMMSRFEEPSISQRLEESEAEYVAARQPPQDASDWRRIAPPPLMQPITAPADSPPSSRRTGAESSVEPHREDARFAARMRELEELFLRGLRASGPGMPAADVTAWPRIEPAPGPREEHLRNETPVRPALHSEPSPSMALLPAMKEVHVREVERRIERVPADLEEPPRPAIGAPSLPRASAAPVIRPAFSPEMAPAPGRPSSLIVNSTESPTPRTSAAPPTLAVERPSDKPAPAPTVHVSIGRIEIRTPPPVDKKPMRSNQAAPKIMTLDEYIRRRHGGAG